MAWTPPDDQFNVTLQRLVTRAREDALTTFRREWSEHADRMSARGLGQSGALLHGLQENADRAIKTFGTRLTSELFQLFRDVHGTLSPDVLHWIRETVGREVDGLVRGLGGQIDERRLRMSVPPGAVEALRRTGAAVLRDLDIEIGKLEVRARFLRPHVAGRPEPTTDAAGIYDAFICHAGEDKAEVAEPLARKLMERGFRIWLDKYELRIGDRLIQKIDEGLSASRYGVVIVSESFFAKEWPQSELNALAAIEASEGRKKILPVWHRINEAGVRVHSPLLAAVWAARTENGLDAIADEIAAVLRESREEPKGGASIV